MPSWRLKRNTGTIINLQTKKMKTTFNLTGLEDQGLRIGWGIEDITPAGPASLYGQYYERISQYVESPLKVTACCIQWESRDGRNELAIMVSMDLLCPLKALQDRLRDLLREQAPELDARQLFLNATHTHSAPYPDVNSNYGKLLLERLCKAVITAWNGRAPAGVSWGLDYAVTGHNRRVQYADGTTEMYGSTDRPDFVGLEGPADPGIGMLFCWNLNEELTGIIMNVATPAQVVEAKYFVSADYWSEVRKQFKKRFSKDIFVLAQCGAAGDISPRDLARGYRAGEPNMWDVAGIVEIGRRIFQVAMDAYPAARQAIATKVIFRHAVRDISIPTRVVSKTEYEEALNIVKEINSREPTDPASPETAWNRFLEEIRQNEKTRQYGPWDNKNTDYGIIRKKQAVVEQYESQGSNPFYRMELHVIRLGDVAIASNSFELFVDYGLSIMGRSKAKLTFLVQLSCDYNDYLPTERALQGGGYSAMANPVGPAGGKVLVDETVALINSMWEHL